MIIRSEDERAKLKALWGKNCPSSREAKFLEGQKTFLEDARRVWQIALEFIRGFLAFRNEGPCVTVFGSARFDEKNLHYQLAHKIGSLLAEEGISVMTGGGPGIMEAANRGAKEAGGRTLGCNIILPHEQIPNPYLDKWIDFHYFFVRKVMLVKYSFGFIIFPGGFGTLDEIFETATLRQTGKVQNFPIILMGVDYWKPLQTLFNESLIKHKTIDAKDASQLFLTDSPEEALQCLKACGSKKFGVDFCEIPPHCSFCKSDNLPC